MAERTGRGWGERFDDFLDGSNRLFMALEAGAVAGFLGGLAVLGVSVLIASHGTPAVVVAVIVGVIAAIGVGVVVWRARSGEP